MSVRLLVVFVLMSFSSVALGASPNPSVEERLATLETTMKLQYEALSKQIETNHQAALKQIETNRQSTLKLYEALSKQIETNRQATLQLIEVTNSRIDTLNNWIIALFGTMVTCAVAIVTYALGLWETPKRDKAVTAEANAHSPEVSHTA